MYAHFARQGGKRMEAIVYERHEMLTKSVLGRRLIAVDQYAWLVSSQMHWNSFTCSSTHYQTMQTCRHCQSMLRYTLHNLKLLSGIW